MKRLVTSPCGVAAVRQQLQFGQMLFAAPAGIVQFDAGVVADGGEVTAVEEGAGVGQFRPFIAIFEAAAGIAHVES